MMIVYWYSNCQKWENEFFIAVRICLSLIRANIAMWFWYFALNVWVFLLFCPLPFLRKKGAQKLAPSVRLSVRPALRFRPKTQQFMKGFWNNMAQMFTIIIRRVMRNNQTPVLKSHLEVKGQHCLMDLFHPLREFKTNWLKWKTCG